MNGESVLRQAATAATSTPGSLEARPAAAMATASGLPALRPLPGAADSATAVPPPAFQPGAAGRPHGPRQLRFQVPVSGQSYDLPVGVAAFVYRPGRSLAGEWRVSPWLYPGWLPDSVDCGEAGTAVIGGHVSWDGEPGPFAEIAWLEPGDRIGCRAQNGAWHTYAVMGVWTTTYEDSVSWRLPPQTGEPGSILSLFTCTPEITGINFVRAGLVSGETRNDDMATDVGTSQ
jgi:hypothetical protein